MDTHRAWALRLFALAIGSWLYRMEYGFWIMLFGRLGRTPDFRGPFDVVMAFFFYLPNLAVVEAFIRARRNTASAVVKFLAAGVCVFATAFLGLGTYYFVRFLWAPAVMQRLFG